MNFPSLLKEKKVGVVGLGKSGTSVAAFCSRQGAHVVATDDLSADKLTESLTVLQKLPVCIQVGGLDEKALLSADLIVLSPGVPPSLPALVAARTKGIPIVGEIELASCFIKAPLVGITGTNGKSTVTALCGAIAAQTGRPSFCGGNLGTPLIDAVGTPAAGPEGLIVCELSSFQLETAQHLHCKAAAILNLTPDHLDRYSSFEAYGDAKARIFLNQNKNDTLVLSADDIELDRLQKRHSIAANLVAFSTRAQKQNGFVQGDQLVLRWANRPSESYPISELNLAGRHNLANALAAFLLMRVSGLATYEQVRAAARTFLPLPHRMEKIAEWKGISFYDDSKGTNVDAVVASLDGFPKPFALIAGGKDKGGSYQPLRQALQHNTVRGVVLIGEAAPLIEQALVGLPHVVRAATMEEAVTQAARFCQTGDAVILSPACSSFDMFHGYAHRAQVFAESIQSLIQKNDSLAGRSIP